MEKAVMVIGAGVAGIQASLDLADKGLIVHLVEKTPSMERSPVHVESCERAGAGASGGDLTPPVAFGILVSTALRRKSRAR